MDAASCVAGGVAVQCGASLFNAGFLFQSRASLECGVPLQRGGFLFNAPGLACDAGCRFHVEVSSVWGVSSKQKLS